MTTHRFRKEVIGEATLYHGDCLETLADIGEANTIAAFITDPPYCSGGFTESAKKQAAGQGLRRETVKQIGWFAGDNMTTGGLVWLMRTVSVQAHFMLIDGGTLTAFTDWRMAQHLGPAMESARFRMQNLLVWNKKHPGLGTGFRPQHEMALHLAKGTPTYHDFHYGNVLDGGRVSAANREHQTEKPVDLITAIVRVTSPIGGMVVDPFMGSGTTGVAAIQTDRQFIGIEADAGYFDVACRRLEAAHRAPRSLIDGKRTDAECVWYSPTCLPRIMNDLFATPEEPADAWREPEP
jgi:site-specific DNA-methyltransferase (adenine-specific)